MNYMIPDGVYQLLKWAALIVLPAAATLIATVGPVWGMDGTLVQAVTTTITAVSAFCGVVLGVSEVTKTPVGGDAQ